MSCKSFLPKFLWKHIIEQLSMADIKTMLIADKSFGNLIDDDMWKQYLFGGIQCNIIIVRCETRRMDDFWKYACYNHTSCNDIDTLFDYITCDTKINATFNKRLFGNTIFNYKAFIKHGNYTVNNKDVEFYHSKCSIELIGGYGGKTTISILNNNRDTKHLYISKCFSIKDITLLGLRIIYVKKCINYMSNLHVSNCYFMDSSFEISSIDNVCISICTFAYTMLVFATSSFGKRPVINYDISNNIFINHDDQYYLALHCDCRKYSVISIVNNIFKNAIRHRGTLINDVSKNVTVTFENNKITNIDSCLYPCKNGTSTVIFKNNIFTKVRSLFYTTIGDAKLCNNNTFVDCGSELTNFIEQT